MSADVPIHQHADDSRRSGKLSELQIMSGQDSSEKRFSMPWAIHRSWKSEAASYQSLNEFLDHGVERLHLTATIPFPPSSTSADTRPIYSNSVGTSRPKLALALALHYLHFLDLARSDYTLAVLVESPCHLQVPPEHKGPKSEAFRVMVGVLKNKLRANIPELSDSFWKRVKDATELEMRPLSSTNENETQNPWRKVRVMPALLRIFTRVNLIVFMGQEHADRADVYDDVMMFFFSCAKAFPILGMVPRFLLPYIGLLAMGLGRTRQKVYDLFVLLTRQAIDKIPIDAKLPTPSNIAHWAAEMTRCKDVFAIAKITLGLLFASAFQVPMVAQFCIHSLCTHPEYHKRLRAEALQYRDASFSATNQEMPLLDSFIKETARLTPGIILSAPRTVMIPFTSAEGYHVPTGNWLAIPQVSLMQDPKIWAHAPSLCGFRFVDETGVSKTRFTHPNYEFPFWGSIRHAYPARFYVCVVLKMILSYIMVEYELELMDAERAPFVTFGMIRLPNPFMCILVRRRVA
ncbi:hypothetical protein DSL72_006031 [Monilinia vaccinii-corymbosi]|uniref:Cytochrome P450 n=1 Tax=Monilinia vaccinii-corymbosi TaxID=61207 RepID=A0A8A3PHC8_9HELO|nr:hypothetical protein DSL72_006031 [Monilinia vaccinii-corymbosi]